MRAVSYFDPVLTCCFLQNLINISKHIHDLQLKLGFTDIMLQETTMMLHTPLTLTKEGTMPLHPANTEYQVHSNNQYQVTNTEFKLPTRKERENILLRYAKKLGLNDRGCYLAVGLSIITFLLLVVIIIMAALWPGN